jgi:hypothetical protein
MNLIARTFCPIALATSATIALMSSLMVEVKAQGFSSQMGSPMLLVTDTVRTDSYGMLGQWGLLELKAPPARTVKAVESRHSFGLALMSDESVVGWGYNFTGAATAPQSLRGISALSEGNGFSLALTNDGRITAWGDLASYHGVAPVPSTADFVSICAGAGHALGIRTTGQLIAWGNNDFGKATVPTGLTNVIGVSAGYLHSLALKADGTVVAWGNNSPGQSSVPAGLSNVVAVSAGQWHSAALLANGSVRTWSSYLNHWAAPQPKPEDLRDVVAISAGGYSVMALHKNGTVTGWGGHEAADPAVFAKLANVIAISAGYTNAAALHSDGTVTSWGDYVWDGMPGYLSPPAQGSDRVHCQIGFIENIGTSPLTVTGVVIDGVDADQFSVQTTQTTNIAPGGKSSFALRFYPTRLGSAVASLKIYSTDPNGPFILPLSGTGKFNITATKPNVANSSFTYAALRPDRSTGLMLQKITFTNTIGSSLHGLRLILSKVASGVHLYSSSAGAVAGTLEVIYSNAIKPNETISFDLVYFDPKRRTAESMNPIIKAEALIEPEPESPPMKGTLVPLLSAQATAQGPLLQWNSVPRALYVVEYSDDAGTAWFSAVHRLSTGGTRVFWIDRGQPETKTKPKGAPNKTGGRFYRVKKL